MSSRLLQILLVGVLTALSAVVSATAGVIYDATGGTENGGDSFNIAGPVLANRFITASAGTLASVSLNLALSTGSAQLGSFAVELFTDQGSNAPSAMTSIATVQDSTLTSNFQLLTFSPTQTILLAANTPYYIGVMSSDSAALLGNTVDNEILARPSVAAGGFYYNNSGVQTNDGGPYEISINVPEPASMVLLVAGLFGFMAARRKSTK